MSANTTKPGLCNADRTQRKYCLYFHQKTGRCTKPSDDSTWQSILVRPQVDKTK